MKSEGTLLLSRKDVMELLGLDECIAAVEQAFKAHAEGRSLGPGVLGVHANGGGFHIKAAGLELSCPYFAAKINGNFFNNRERFEMPNIQGVVVLFDAENGAPLAVMDSIEITILRTGAATGVAAKYLSREDSAVVTICGCGDQGRISLRAIAHVRQLTQVYGFDTDRDRSERYAAEMSDELGFSVTAVTELDDAVGKSDIVVTCTPSNEPFLWLSNIAAGTFIAAVGADNETKQELDPQLLAASKVVVDTLEQCSAIGDLKRALHFGLMTAKDVHAELGEVIAGLKPGRESSDEIIVFDSTGTALQDVASAAIVYERAVSIGRGLRINFAD